MPAFLLVNERSRWVTILQTSSMRTDRRLERAQAADVPACDLRPDVELFSSTSGRIIGGSPRNNIQHPPQSALSLRIMVYISRYGALHHPLTLPTQLRYAAEHRSPPPISATSGLPNPISVCYRFFFHCLFFPFRAPET